MNRFLRTGEQEIMGKGSRQRPSDKKKFNEGWDRIFHKKGANEDKATNFRRA